MDKRHRPDNQKDKDIRERAERLLLQRNIPKVTSRSNVDRLIHEISVHQIELELQNEELQKARDELESYLDKYTDLYDFAPISYFSINADGMIEEVNFTGASLLGVVRSDLVKKYFLTFVHPDDESKFYIHLHNTLETGATIKEELRLVRPDGKELWVSMDSVSVEAQKGKRAIRTTIIDITSRKHAESGLLQQTEDLDNFFNLTQDLLLIADADRKIRKINRSWEVLLGYELRDLIDSNIYDLIHPDDIEKTLQARTDLSAGKAVTNFQNRLRNKDGTYLWVEWNSVLVGNSLYATARDISTRKKQEEELLKLNRTLRAISNVNQVIIHSNDELKLLQDVCRIIKEDCGYPMLWIGYADDDERKTVHPVASAGFGKGSLDVFTTTWGGDLNLLCPTGKAIRTGKPSICRNIAIDPNPDAWREESLKRGYASSIALPLNEGEKVFGSIHIYSDQTDPFLEDEINLLNELARDLSYGILNIRVHTAKAKAEEEIKQNEARLELALKAGHAGSFDFDMKSDKALWSDELLKLYGLKREEFGMRFEDWIECLVPEDREAVIASVQEEHKTGVFNQEFRIRLRNTGEIRWMHGQARVFFDQNGTPERIVGIHMDITDRKKAEIALRESEERFRYLQEASFGGIGIHDKGRILDCNQGLADITGYSIDELVGMNGLLLITSEWRDFVMQKILTDYEKPYVVEGLRKDGSVYPLEIRGRNIPYHGKVARVTEFRDITELKKAEDEKKQLESQLAQSQKMEALGTLAGGVAHDFNNILTAIMGYTELARMSTNEPDKVEKNLNNSMKSCKRAKDLVTQILSFSRHAAGEFTPLTLRYTVKESLNMLRSMISSNIEITTNLDSPGKIMADPSQINQMIMNLSVNAAQAMGMKGGVLNVVLKNVSLDEDSAHELGLTAGSYLQLTLSDTGQGMGSDVMSRIFEPYFTTKKETGSSGMGLSIVHGIVKRHGGAIAVQSIPGEGTTFKIYLPEAISVEEEVPEDKELAVSKGTERILFVDDEKALVEVADNLLSSLGYKVTATTSSVTALDLFKKDPDQFDLVVTDMTMPAMMGDKLAQEILKIRPNIPIIMYTGYSEYITEEKAKSMGIRKFILKPFEVDDLAKSIRKVLDTK